MLKFQQNRKEPELIRILCVTCPGAETMTRNYSQTKDKCNHALWWMKQIHFSTKLYFHSTSPGTNNWELYIVLCSRTIYYQEIQYCSYQILTCFSRLLNLHSTPGVALSIEISCSPKWLLAFLKKIFCHPKTLVFH